MKLSSVCFKNSKLENKKNNAKRGPKTKAPITGREKNLKAQEEVEKKSLEKVAKSFQSSQLRQMKEEAQKIIPAVGKNELTKSTLL